MRIIMLSVLMALVPAVIAAAPVDLGAAKGDGLVGEQENGYLGLVQADAPSAVRSFVADVNRQRRARYQTIAQRNGISREDVEARAGQTAIDRSPRGHYVKVLGLWRRK